METQKTTRENEARETKPTEKSDGHALAPQADPVAAETKEKEKEKEAQSKSGEKQGAPRKKAATAKNNVRTIRTEKMMSKAELARRAGMSTLTIDRVERGLPCRMDTKRKILEALGLKPADRVLVFGGRRLTTAR